MMASMSADVNKSAHTTWSFPDSAKNTSAGPPFPPFGSFWFVMQDVKYYGEPPIVAVGLLGNILAYLVFTRTKLRKVPSVPYLAGMAVVDSGFLCTYFLSTLTFTYRVPIMSQVGICQFGTFSNFVFLFLSMWYLVAVVVEKFICVFWPLRKSSMCTVFRAKVVLISLAVLAIASYSYVIYFFGPDAKYRHCKPWREFHSQYANLYMLDAFVVYVAPLLTIIVLLVLIVIRGCEYYRISSAADFAPRLHSSDTSVSITKVLFPVIFLVLLCQVPNSTALVLGFFIRHMTSDQRTELLNASVFFLFLSKISFAFKCVVYLIFSRSFRYSFIHFLQNTKDRIRRMFCCCNSARDVDPQRIAMHGCSGQHPTPHRLIQSDV